ncbi:protein of unknown function DUF323 [Rhodomicrobium vannielii ATCC 17100]|uniref:Sulfatase-modifying factor enzyme-like domain-containing protein n=1 Tax=Rhodomicrobium vannielii (strain ATCC 17100 / DSM 162 / LMG 4299 / NCIMB 10020 / ATH 3.1.1) TaxID=648757 RepID=E3I321_RHOVT|nr:formylglycine-generating enzyme family protein [Rhodomicrobium vannielii]ADP70315.1 protein of unknown function DUF323 [Rhodomicrobium vannielii ATCC 17100]
MGRSILSIIFGSQSPAADDLPAFAPVVEAPAAPARVETEEERAERERLETLYKEEGRIEVDAPHPTNEHGRWFVPGVGKTEWFKDIEAGPELVVVPAGRFLQGAPNDEPQREAWEVGAESPQHETTIPKPFAIGRAAVTRGEFKAFVAATGHDAGTLRNQSFPQDDSHPIVGVSWRDATAYVEWLSKITRKQYRLPSEAEWEYAARAGTTTPFWWGASITPEQANYDGTHVYEGGGEAGVHRNGTVPVLEFEANPWGLYQVHGNVSEWCADQWHRGYWEKKDHLKASGGPQVNGNSGHVLRGGSWGDGPQFLRAASRSRLYGDIRLGYYGFRVARSIA